MQKLYLQLKNNKLVILFFSIILIVGCLTFKDYGISHDEVLQRHHSYISFYRYYDAIINKSITGKKKITSSDYKKVNNVISPELDKNISNYIFKYYGVAFQIPLFLIEYMLNYNLEMTTVYLIRHLATFLIFWFSLIFFYRILNRFILKDKKLALLGTLFLVISPRIYGDAFYNIKDLVFLSLCIINIYYCLNYIESDKFKNIILLSLISAFCINCRVIGILLPSLAILIKIIKEYKINFIKSLNNIILLIIFTFIFYVLITPMSWPNPFTYIFEVISCFYSYKDPIHPMDFDIFYFGKFIKSSNLPWHYLIVFMFITTPLIYVLLFICGCYSNIKNLVKEKLNKININILFCNLILIICHLFFIICRPDLYCGWRHFYFLYPILIIDAIIGFKFLITKIKYKKIIYLVITINLIILVGWMIKNHPYQMEFYDLTFEKYYFNNFGSSFLQMGNNDAIKYIAKNDKRKKIVIYSLNDAIIYNLSKCERKRFSLTYDIGKVDYIIDANMYPVNYEGFTEFNYKMLDQIRLYTIYKRIKN